MTHLFLIVSIVKKEKHGYDSLPFYQKEDNINADGVPHYGTSVKIICV
jgi:hypothetical protein